MKRLATFTLVGALAGMVVTHATSCYLCYEYVRDQGYTRGTCAVFGLSVGAVDYVYRKRKDLESRIQ